MSIIQAGLDALARFLGADPATQQDVVYSEASARKALSRRDFLRTAGAVAAGTLFVDQVVREMLERPHPWVAQRAVIMPPGDFKVLSRRLAERDAERALWVEMDATQFEIGDMWSWGDGSGKPAGKAVVTGISHERGIITLDSAPRGSV